MKGCPLNCVWCHNPESIAFHPQLMYLPERCIGCAECAAACKNGAHGSDANGLKYFDRTLCDNCGSCASVCAAGAIRTAGKEMETDEVLNEVLKDKLFYINSGGGVTLTGGEPMAQFEFSMELLQKCKAAGLHTCMETCGYCDTADIHSVKTFTDLFLFDYKDTAAESHTKFTGADNEIILKNLDSILKAGANVILRCPLIHGVNDTMEHMEGIAALLSNHPDLKGFEIMPYHNLGTSKAKQLGTEGFSADIKNTGPDIKRGWTETLRKLAKTRAARLLIG